MASLEWLLRVELVTGADASMAGIVTNVTLVAFDGPDGNGSHPTPARGRSGCVRVAGHPAAAARPAADVALDRVTVVWWRAGRAADGLRGAGRPASVALAGRVCAYLGPLPGCPRDQPHLVSDRDWKPDRRSTGRRLRARRNDRSRDAGDRPFHDRLQPHPELAADQGRAAGWHRRRRRYGAVHGLPPALSPADGERGRGQARSRHIDRGFRGGRPGVLLSFPPTDRPRLPCRRGGHGHRRRAPPSRPMIDS